MLDRVRCIAGATALPFVADGDTGYGGLLNVERTVRGYAAAGARVSSSKIRNSRRNAATPSSAA